MNFASNPICAENFEHAFFYLIIKYKERLFGNYWGWGLILELVFGTDCAEVGVLSLDSLSKSSCFQ